MAHRQSHALNAVADHSSSITQDNIITADANGLPADGGLALADIDMQSAYDNDAAITFDKNMSWDLDEAYDFILVEGTDNVTIQATAANAISFSAEVNVIDFNAATSIAFDTVDLTIDVTNDVSIGGGKAIKRITLDSEGGQYGGSAALLLDTENTTDTTYTKLSASSDVVGSDALLELLAANTGSAAGDDAVTLILATATGSGASSIFVGRNVAGTTHTDTVELDAETVINIGANAPVVTIGASSAGAAVRLVDANRTGSTWSQGYVPLSDTQADWNTFETNFGEVSLMNALNQAAASGSNPTLDDAYNNDSGERTITIDDGDISWDLSGTNSMLVDLSAATGDAEGLFFEDLDNGDYVRLRMNNSLSGLEWYAAVYSIDFDAETTVNINSATALNIGDDVAELNFDGAGAVSETGMTSLSLTPSGAITLTAGATSTWSTSAGDLNVSAAADLDLDGATVNINSTGALKIGDDVATLDFDGAGAVSETGMTSLSLTPSGAITLTAGATSTWSTSAGDLNVSAAADLDLDGATVNINSTGTLKIGDDVATLDFDGAGAVTETGMTSFTISPSGAIALTSGDTSNLTMAVTNAADRTLTIEASNAGAGDGILDLKGDTVNIGNAGATVIDAQSNKITNMDPGTAGTDAVNKSQLDAAISGLSWQDPAVVLQLKSDANQSGVDPTAGGTGEAWLVNNWATETDGDIVEWSGSAWVTIVAHSGGEPPDGTRAVIIGTGATGDFTGQEDDIAVYATSGSSWSFTTAANGMAILIDGAAGVYENTGWTYDDTPGEWVQFSGANLYTAGNGIGISSNVISLGALTGDWAAGAFDITGLAILDTDELMLGVVAQAAQPTPTSGCGLIWRDTDDSNAIYLVFNDPTSGVVSVELT